MACSRSGVRTVDSELWDVAGARCRTAAARWDRMVDRWGVERRSTAPPGLGDCWYGNADLTPETAARDIALYREACARHDRTPVRIPIRKDVFVAEDRAEADKVGDALLAGGYRGFERGAVAYGDPESVAEQLSVFGELGFTDVIIRTMSPVPSELGADAAEPLGRVGSRCALPARLIRIQSLPTVPATGSSVLSDLSKEVGALMLSGRPR